MRTGLARGHRHACGLVAVSSEAREKEVMGNEQRKILVRQCSPDIECCVLLEAERYELVSCIILPSFLVEDKRLGNMFCISIPNELVFIFEHFCRHENVQ